MTSVRARDIRIDVDSVGEAWLAIARQILTEGRLAWYDGLPIVEVAQATIAVEHPSPTDEIIDRLADPERLAWMHANFTDHARVDALGGARSYASRLYDYGATGLNQIDWVIERLKKDPESRSATITTFEPLSDTSYIPCVSMLDFWIRDGAVEQVVYAHSIDFGTKGYANLVELADLQQRVAQGLGMPVGRLLFIVKSAHIYETEFEVMQSILQ
jgi:thymidylate synthase